MLEGALTNVGPLDLIIEFEESAMYVFEVHT
jgi:hypothetical protein